MKSIWKAGNNVLVNSKRATIISRVRIVSWGFSGQRPGSRCNEKKIFRYLILLASLSLHAAAWGDMADNGVECSVVMEKTEFDARAAFPDFKLVFTNKGEKDRASFR